MRRRWRRTIAATAAFAMVAVTAPSRARGEDGAGASAQPSSSKEAAREASRAAYRRGAAQYDNGNFEAARDSFAEAYKLFPHPSILYSLGLSRLKTRDYLLAEKDLLKFLEDDGGAPPQEVANARAALAQVRQHLGTFLLRVMPTGARAQLDDDAVALIPGKFVEVRTTTGTHTLRVDASGFEAREQSVVVGAAQANVEIDLRRVGEAGGEATRPAARTALAARPRDGSSSAPARRPPRSPSSPRSARSRSPTTTTRRGAGRSRTRPREARASR